LAIVTSVKMEGRPKANCFLHVTAHRLTTIAHKEKPLVLGQTKRTKYKIRTNYTL